MVLSKIALFHNVKRPVQYVFVDAADVFPDDADGKQLHPAQKGYGDDERRPPGNGSIKDKVRTESVQQDQKRQERDHKPRLGNQTQGAVA